MSEPIMRKATPFEDRAHAGTLLARTLARDAPGPDVVFGLPRGGVPVAFAVATALRAALDVVVVRKLGLPYQPEYAVGAIGSGGVCVHARAATLTQQSASVLRAEQAELVRRERLYRGGRAPLALAGQHVVLVDDGIATGNSMLAAIEVVRAAGAAMVTVAAPVAAPDAVQMLRQHADRVVCLLTPAQFGAVSRYYRNFAQLQDEDVRSLLSIASRM